MKCNIYVTVAFSRSNIQRKAIKGTLALNMTEFRHVHNLTKSSSVLVQSIDFGYTIQELAHPTAMAISTRYDAGNIDKTHKGAHTDKAYGLARNIYDDVKSEFSRQSVSR